MGVTYPLGNIIYLAPERWNNLRTRGCGSEPEDGRVASHPAGCGDMTSFTATVPSPLKECRGQIRAPLHHLPGRRLAEPTEARLPRLSSELDAGSRKENASNQESTSRSDSIGTKKALVS
jgi:hypothetical protein